VAAPTPTTAARRRIALSCCCVLVSGHAAAQAPAGRAEALVPVPADIVIIISRALARLARNDA